MRDHRDLAHLLLRVTVGSLFLTLGLRDLNPRSPEILPATQAVIGALLILGLFTALTVAAAMMLTVAVTVLHAEPAPLSRDLPLAVALFALYYTLERNGWSADALLRRVRHRTADPKAQTTALRVHTSGGDDIVFGVVPASDAVLPSLYVTRADELEPPAGIAKETSARHAGVARDSDS